MPYQWESYDTKALFLKIVKPLIATLIPQSQVDGSIDLNGLLDVIDGVFFAPFALCALGFNFFQAL